MVTELRRFVLAEGRYVTEYRGLSTDTKPTGNINGSLFREIDTGKCYRYDEESDAWYLQQS